MLGLYTYDTNKGKNINMGFQSLTDMLLFFRLSTCMMKKYAGITDIQINTDAAGYNVLTEVRDSVFDKAIVIKECKFPNLVPGTHIWNHGKLYSYKEAGRPFLHTDIDLVVLSDIKDKLKSDVYTEIMCSSSLINKSDVLSSFRKKYTFLDDIIENEYYITSAAIGGNDIQIFDNLYSSSCDFILENKDIVKEYFNQYIAIMLEEMLFTNIFLNKYGSFNKEGNKNIVPLFRKIDKMVLKDMQGYKHWGLKSKRDRQALHLFKNIYCKQLGINDYTSTKKALSKYNHLGDNSIDHVQNFHSYF